jgi:transcriptional regulator with XRE-family HTH domain
MKLTEIKAALRRMRDEETTEQRDDRAALVLSSRFLSEVERIMTERGITRKALAADIGTSASYVTQLFRGDCTLNLLTAARLQRVLGIDFRVKAVAPISRPAAQVHPIMLRKLPMPEALHSHRFNEHQVQVGGRKDVYFAPAPSTKVEADIFA